MANQLKITLKRSTIGTTEDQRLTVKTLGLRKINQTVLHNDTPQIRGMVKKIAHMLNVEEI